MVALPEIHSQIFLWLQKANMPTSRGTIKGYELEMYNPSSGSTFVSNISVDVRNYSVTFCAECEVKVWARNSKGLSPPAKITVSHTKGKRNTNKLNSACLEVTNAFVIWVFITSIYSLAPRLFSWASPGRASNTRQPQCHHLLEKAWNCTASCRLCGGVVPRGSQVGEASVGPTER